MHSPDGNLLENNWFSSDDQFNHLYPDNIRSLSRKHWTPMLVAEKAADFLGTVKGSKILDIGSGVGKFCLCAAHYYPETQFFGIEQRPGLIEYAEKAKKILNIKNVHFIQGNFTSIDLAEYDHFYLYNSFYENLRGTEKIDETIEYKEDLYSYYNRYFLKQMEKTRPGTRLATYHSIENEVPQNFHEVGSAINNLLKFWINV